jgi:hypothetical protein
MKICKTCKIEKCIEDFHKKQSRCKECAKIKYLENKEDILRKTNEYYHSNKDLNREKRRDYYHKNKEVLRPKMNEWKKDNKDKIKSSNKLWYENNKVEVSIKNKVYNSLHESKIKRNDYIRNKKKNDSLFKLKINVGSLIRESIKRRDFIKKSKSIDILGCSFEEFKLYMESKFEPWMNWDNHGLYNGELNYGWDIDHITPMSSAQTEEEVYKLNHYTNLQPLCSYTNRYIKKDSLTFNI